MARIPKHLLSYSEASVLIKEDLIHEKNEDTYSVRDKDLDQVFEIIKLKSMNEDNQSIEQINSRAYTMKTVTMIMTLIKQSTTITDYIGLVGAINTLYPLDPDSAIRLMSVLKSNMNW